MRGKKVMITGGMGMIGSTIACKAVELGARVLVVDACIEPYGANRFNLEACIDNMDVNVADIRDREAMKTLVRGQDIIFNLAGQVSHNDSMQDPFLDADINYIGHLNVLECVREYNPEACILHAGSRLQFGRIERTPVDEGHPMRPLTPYALNKTAAENMYLFYNHVHGIRCALFRLANPYGPRSQMRHSKYSMVNWFIRQAMDGKDITVFGEGSQVRDFVFVDDVADAFIRASVSEACTGQVLNIGSGRGTRFAEMAEMVVRAVGTGSVIHVPWPDEYVNVETGDYVADIRRIQEFAGWQSTTGIEEGIALTVEYYRKHREHYWHE